MTMHLRYCTGAVLLALLAGCQPDTPPEKLSEWNLLAVTGSAGQKQLRLADDVLPYELATPLFSDYARKLRTVRLPAGRSASYRPEEPFRFPEGTVLSKTFYYPIDEDGVLQLTATSGTELRDGGLDLSAVELIETRLLVRERDGWTALPYVWNPDQSEATLRRQGDIRRLSGRDDDGTEHEFAYLVPNRNECGGCHITEESTGRIEPIGPAARHLNRRFDHYRTGPAPQLRTWAERGLLEGLPEDHDAIPALPVWDAAATDRTEARARAWLDINCAHCHQPGGPADNSGLFLGSFEQDRVRLGHCKPPVAAGRGTGGHRFSLQPGAPRQSILYHRMASTEPDVMMPELGRSLVQQEALTLIGRWIEELPGSCQ
ncbi:MAG: SO2930 family diheme c-type cytochrome [Pseudomonadota bacterium]